MKYQKIINLLDNTSNQLSKFRTKNWAEINDDLSGTYNTNTQIKFKTLMLQSSLCNYSDVYILVKGTTIVTNTGAIDTVANNASKKIVIKNCTPFTDYISGINNTQLDNAKDIVIIMSMFSLIENSDNYSKTSPSIWQYYRDKPAVNVDSISADFPGQQRFL